MSFASSVFDVFPACKITGQCYDYAMHAECLKTAQFVPKQTIANKHSKFGWQIELA